jgi:hypothetical protein
MRVVPVGSHAIEISTKATYPGSTLIAPTRLKSESDSPQISSARRLLRVPSPGGVCVKRTRLRETHSERAKTLVLRAIGLLHDVQVTSCLSRLRSRLAANDVLALDDTVLELTGLDVL